MNLGRLESIPISQIELGNRRREDYGNVDELAASIKERGLICPIAIQSDNGKPPFKLCAGGRRLLACTLLEMKEISCRIYDQPLSLLELKAIELFENLDRKDLSFKEECDLKRDIHNLMTEIHGEKTSTSLDAPGWSMRDTAKFLNRSSGGVSNDIKLSTVMEAAPQLGLDKCKNKSEAMKLISRAEETLVRAELAKRAEKQLGNSSQKLADAYIVGDFFDKIKEIPSNCIDLVEIDPPYAIDLPSIKKSDLSYRANYGESYNEVDAKYYPTFIKDTLKECYRVMNNHSWLILWFGPDPWFETIYSLLTSVGFKTRRLTGIWKKGNSPGQCLQPSMYLGASYENFYYARKGDANITKQGRSAIFDFDPVPPAQKVHPTERPVEMMEEILRTFTWEGSRVLVPFAGSGNTLIAAANNKMLPVGFDLSSIYKDAYVARLLRKEING